MVDEFTIHVSRDTGKSEIRAVPGRARCPDKRRLSVLLLLVLVLLLLLLLLLVVLPVFAD